MATKACYPNFLWLASHFNENFDANFTKYQVYSLPSNNLLLAAIFTSKSDIIVIANLIKLLAEN